MQINDCHIHVGKSSQIYASFNTKDVLKFKVVKDIENVLIFSNDLNTYTNNKAVAKLASEWAFIYGLYWMDGLTTVDNMPITDKMIGGKYHGAYARRPIKAGWSLLEHLEKKEAVLMVHCGRYKEGSIESNTSYLHALEVAKSYPNICVIMAHMGGTDTTVSKKAIKDSRDYGNVYFDTSGITTPYIIEYALTQLEPNRVIFGSDAPWCSFGAMVATILDANIADFDKNLILSENFKQLVKCTLQPKQSI